MARRCDEAVRHSWEEGVGVVWFGKRNNGYHNTGDM